MMNNFCKLLLAGAGIAALLPACKKDTSAPDPEVEIPPLSALVPKVTESVVAKEMDVQARFDQCWRAYNERDAETLKGCYAGDAVSTLVDHVPPVVAKGKDGVLAVAQDFWTAFPDIHAEAQLVLVNGRNIAAIVHMQGTNEGPFMGKPATGKPVSFFASQAVALNANAMVVTDQHWIDQPTIAHQLGLPGFTHSPEAATKWFKKVRTVAKNTPKEATNLALARKMDAALQRGDQKAYLSDVSDDVEFRYVAGKEDMRGKAAFSKGLTKWREMADYESELESRWAAGDWVVSTSQNVATMKEDMEGFKGSKGKEVRTKQQSFAQFENDKLKALWVFENTAAFADQLGEMTSAEMDQGTSAKPPKIKTGSLSPK